MFEFAETPQEELLPILELFKGHLPDNLYLNHYKLHEVYPRFSSEEWRNFLRENDHFIRTELSAITEAEARSAIQRLTKGDAKSADISAIKQLLEQSEAMNAKTKDARTFVVTHMPDKDYTDQKNEQVKIVKENSTISQLMFNTKRLYDLPNLVQNADGTLHILKPTTELELAYLRLFNSDNERISSLAPFAEEDVQ